MSGDDDQREALAKLHRAPQASDLWYGKGTGLAFSVPIVMRPSSQLRWSKAGKLQQLWFNHNDSAMIEWRDVPTEE